MTFTSSSRTSSTANTHSLRIKAIALIAISFAAIAVHGKATRNLKLMMPDKPEVVSVLRHPRMH